MDARKRTMAWLVGGLCWAACADEHGASGAGSDGPYGFATGPLMQPGADCEFCHRPGSDYEDAPDWSLAGTVYARLDAGADEGVPGVDVIVYDMSGREALRLTSNAAGNFYTAAALPEGYTVALANQGQEVAMPCTPPSGGCAKCHRSSPIGEAPGRLVIPQALSEPRPAFDCERWVSKDAL